MNEIHIRLAGMEELPRISYLKKQIHALHAKGRPDLFQPKAPEEEVLTFFDPESTKLLLAERDGKAVGYALLQPMERKANPYMLERRYVHVEEFCVEEACRHMGVGRKLMNAVKEYAKANGYPRIELDVWAFNKGAEQFYEAVGLKPFRVFMEMDTDE